MTAHDKPPPSIQYAVRFIYAGAAIQALSAAVAVATISGRIQSALATVSTTPLTASQLHMAKIFAVAFLVIAGLIGVAAWLWMASKNSAGRRWARVLSTVFFALATVGLIDVIAQPVTVETKILPVADWLAGVCAITLLWQRESSEFFSARSRRY
jgi:hypothetical protein